MQPLTALTILRMEISKCWMLWACVSTKMRRKEAHLCEYPADIQESSVRLLRKHVLLARMLSSAKAFLIRYVGRLCFSLSSEHVQKPWCLWWILLDVFVLLRLCGSDLPKASYQPSVPLNGGDPSKQINDTASGGWHYKDLVTLALFIRVFD